jgi:hypothetical protein
VTAALGVGPIRTAPTPLQSAQRAPERLRAVLVRQRKQVAGPNLVDYSPAARAAAVGSTPHVPGLAERRNTLA